MRATTFRQERLALHQKMAEAYHGFLAYTFLQNEGNPDLHRGLAEARNRFLSSYFIESENHAVPGWVPDEVQKRYRGSSRRYLLGDYYSEAALREIGNPVSRNRELRFEHLRPKGEAIRKRGEAEYEKGVPVSVDTIAGLLDENWHIAVITRAENGMLRSQRKMPGNAGDLFAGYRDDTGDMLFPLVSTVEDGPRCGQLLRAGHR
ncbi:hypothetical protein [Paraburkholderia dinghuensis]|uniref:Uncharacterized protein n=1 Tax=Paraburkholderia dinghuensis TaxID=2305225 RepID=A0A3N6NKL8_9BURK|nr:hypothetical protein [Paraburkholderia dinghuensis]RQG99812.1 hypothetical protein D1Y85_26155 [Paraburkholderia dinghuensis]